MFNVTVFILLAALLFLSTGAAIYMGIFKSHKPGVGAGRKFFTGLISFTLSGAYWFLSYGYYYLGF